MWATDLLPLVEYGQVDLALDEHYIAQFLVQSIETHRTPYVNIRAVEPGHVMVFREGRLRKNEWHWKPDPKKEIRYRTDGEYEEHFYALFRQSVKARLQSDGRPVWADLSGGLDSSSIVCMADDILAKGGAECPRVDTWTAVNGESILTNELPYVRLVEEKRGREGFHLREDELWFKGILEIKEPVLIPQALLCIPERFRMLQEQMDAAGARVRLNGHGGDHLLWKLSEPSVEIADALRRGRVFELHRLVRVWSAAMRIPYVQVLFKYGIAKLLPEPVARSFRPERMGLRFLRDRRVAARYRREPPFPPDRFGCRSVRGRMQSSVLLAAIRFVASEPMPSSLRAEVRYPFLSRPLAEYLFAVPHSQKQRPHESRSLMRRAFRELLPHGIGLRETKGSVDEAVCRGLNTALDEVEFLISSRLSAWAGLDYEALSDAMRDVIHGGSTNRGDALRLIALALFTVNAEARVPSTVSPAFPKAAFRISAPTHGGTPQEAPVVGTERTSC
jgi:asparagine synthase (glutamine-hydrolysing)